MTLEFLLEANSIIGIILQIDNKKKILIMTIKYFLKGLSYFHNLQKKNILFF